MENITLFKNNYSDKCKVYVYTDGSFSPEYPDRYAGAYLVYQGTRCIYSDSGCGTRAVSMRNVAGELSAVMRAARWIKQNNYRAVIVYDYTGIYEWVMGNWRAKNEFTKAYKKFMQPYINDGTITFKWVKAHNGDLGNTMADNLARKTLRLGGTWADDRKVNRQECKQDCNADEE